MKITREELEKKVAVLEADTKRLVENDYRLRTILCDLLNHVEYCKPSYSYGEKTERKVVVESWEGVAFLIGQLKSDARNSVLFKENEDNKVLVGDLHGEIERLKNGSGEHIDIPNSYHHN